MLLHFRVKRKRLTSYFCSNACTVSTACRWANSAYPLRGTMNAVGNSGFKSIDHAQRQSVHYLHVVDSMNGTTNHLIHAVSHHWQLLDMQFLTIYLIYSHAHPNFHIVYILCRSIYRLLIIDFYCSVLYRPACCRGVLNVSFGTCFLIFWNKRFYYYYIIISHHKYCISNSSVIRALHLGNRSCRCYFNCSNVKTHSNFLNLSFNKNNQ